MQPQLRVRRAKPSDAAAFALICLKTGRYGDDGTSDFPNDPDALSRIYTSPYLTLQLDLALALEDKATGAVVGYCLAATDSEQFYARYEADVRPALAAAYPDADSAVVGRWSAREQEIHRLYHHPDYSIPEPRGRFPSHLHIDLLPAARRRGFGRLLVRLQLAQLASSGSPGVHLGLAASNTAAMAFYSELGFSELSRDADNIIMGRALAPLPTPGPPPVSGDCNVASYLAGPGSALACGTSVFGPAWVAVTQPDPWAVAEVSLFVAISCSSFRQPQLIPAIAGLAWRRRTPRRHPRDFCARAGARGGARARACVGSDHCGYWRRSRVRRCQVHRVARRSPPRVRTDGTYRGRFRNAAGWCSL